MFIVITLIVLFVLISIYLFFRAEGLQTQLNKAKRETKQIKKDNTALIESMLVSATKNEEFTRFRLNEIKSTIEEDRLTEALSDEIEILTLLTLHYSSIYRECLLGQVQLKTITKTCFDACAPGAFNNFTRYIATQEIGIKKMWASNNLQGFISLVEALLLQFDKKLRK
ncbi:MAG: hypothetical protein ACSHW0_11360 [Thalassotalea sp.]